MYYFLIQWNSNEEDLFINNIISIIPFITNEEIKLKLYDHPLLFDSDISVSIDPIWIVDNLGRLNNSNDPP